MSTVHLPSLLKDLLRHKPRGWSIVRRGNELQARPPEREVCKFVIRRNLRQPDALLIGRFDRQLNRWTGLADCPADAVAVVAHLVDHVRSVQAAI